MHGDDFEAGELRRFFWRAGEAIDLVVGAEEGGGEGGADVAAVHLVEKVSDGVEALRLKAKGEVDIWLEGL